MLLHHLEHTAGIYGFFATLSEAASQERLQGREHLLLWWETGPSCERRYHDHEHWHNFRPDAMGEYQAGERRVRFWLEWVRRTTGTRAACHSTSAGRCSRQGTGNAHRTHRRGCTSEDYCGCDTDHYCHATERLRATCPDLVSSFSQERENREGIVKELFQHMIASLFLRSLSPERCRIQL